MKQGIQIQLKRATLAVALTTGLAIGGSAWAAATANHSVTFTITTINELAVSAVSGTLTVDSATAGSAPGASATQTATLSITTNDTATKKVTAASTALPTGVTLNASVASPTGTGTGGTGAAQNLSTTAADVVTGIANFFGTATITYTLTAAITAAPQTATSLTVTYTLADV